MDTHAIRLTLYVNPVTKILIKLAFSSESVDSLSTFVVFLRGVRGGE